jgi:zinc protease
VKAQFVRERETAMKTNRFWVDWLSRSARYNDDPKIILDQAPLLARITSDNVKASALRFLDKKRLFQIVMLPAAK